jgi:hypothetical protein
MGEGRMFFMMRLGGDSGICNEIVIQSAPGLAMRSIFHPRSESVFTFDLLPANFVAFSARESPRMPSAET